MQIDRIDAADIPAACDLIAALLRELGGEDGPTGADLLPLATRLIDRPNAEPAVTGFLARDEGVPVGVLMLNTCAAIYAGGAFGEITELYVRPEHRSQGVARQLLKAARQEATRRGWTRLEVGAPTQPDWARTLAFYRREGFSETGPRLRWRV